MSSSWDDFREAARDEKPKERSSSVAKTIELKEDHGTGCDWGFKAANETCVDGAEVDEENSNLSKFIEIYECYLEDKHSINEQTENYSAFRNNPQKALQEWFNNEGHEFSVKFEQPRPDQYICSLDLPVEDQDFTITSESHNKKHEATDEVCLAACRMLDECHLLYSWQNGALSSKEDSDRKRRSGEANKEDDIELDQTQTKRLCDTQRSSYSKSTSKVNTYESLLAKWNELNMCILRLKAELVKLDLSVAKQTKEQNKCLKTVESLGGKTSSVNSGNTNEKDKADEIDPLDEYMSNLETKTKLSMDEKIEKSRIKSQIASFEREQEEVSRFIELAKPKFDLNKACPTSSSVRR